MRTWSDWWGVFKEGAKSEQKNPSQGRDSDSTRDCCLLSVRVYPEARAKASRQGAACWDVSETLQEASQGEEEATECTGKLSPGSCHWKDTRKPAGTPLGTHLQKASLAGGRWLWSFLGSCLPECCWHHYGCMSLGMLTTSPVQQGQEEKSFLLRVPPPMSSTDKGQCHIYRQGEMFQYHK